MIALTQLGLKPASRAGYRQVVKMSNRGVQTSGIMSIAIISPLFTEPIAHCSDEDIYFRLQHSDERRSHGLLQFLS